jgi:hypothetical protein
MHKNHPPVQAMPAACESTINHALLSGIRSQTSSIQAAICTTIHPAKMPRQPAVLRQPRGDLPGGKSIEVLDSTAVSHYKNRWSIASRRVRQRSAGVIRCRCENPARCRKELNTSLFNTNNLREIYTSHALRRKHQAMMLDVYVQDRQVGILEQTGIRLTLRAITRTMRSTG